ncbi:MAG: Beta-N-acetylhexosaminidase, partial [Chitinophagaceae bacterium]|nr:Beta-N-acetylhexosaminidase [Chitinophagaceae bacterium]
MKRFALVITALSAAISYSQVNIIPRPVELKQPNVAGNFTITPSTKIILEGSNLENSANFLNEYLQHFYNFKLSNEKKADGKKE